MSVSSPPIEPVPVHDHPAVVAIAPPPAAQHRSPPRWSLGFARVPRPVPDPASTAIASRASNVVPARRPNGAFTAHSGSLRQDPTPELR